jgi:hypothetical protein
MIFYSEYEKNYVSQLFSIASPLLHVSILIIYYSLVNTHNVYVVNCVLFFFFYRDILLLIYFLL